MAFSNHVTGWLVLLPFSALSIGVAILAITLHRSFLRTLDVFILSVLVSLFFHVSICTGIYIYTLVNENSWSDAMCNFYIWTSFAMRTVELLSLVALNLDRSAIFLFPMSYNYHATHQVAAQVLSIWMVAVLTGCVPVMKLSGFTKMARKQCNFLADDIHLGFAIAIVIFEVTAIVTCLIISMDTLIQWKCIRKSSMFRVRPIAGEITMEVLHGIGCETEIRSRSHHIASAFDNCQTACIMTVILHLLNHLPYVVLVFIGVVTSDLSADTRGIFVTWCLLLAGLLVPNCLWLHNTRYRAVYKLMVAHMRHSTRKESQAVKLESYKQQDTLELKTKEIEVVQPPQVSNTEVLNLSTVHPLNIEYISDIWRPLRQSKHKPQGGSARFDQGTTSQVRHQLPTVKATQNSKSYTETGKPTHNLREPPDGSSRISLTDKKMAPQCYLLPQYCSPQCFHKMVPQHGSLRCCHKVVAQDSFQCYSTGAGCTINDYHNSHCNEFMETYSPEIHSTSDDPVLPSIDISCSNIADRIVPPHDDLRKMSPRADTSHYDRSVQCTSPKPHRFNQHELYPENKRHTERCFTRLSMNYFKTKQLNPKMGNEREMYNFSMKSENGPRSISGKENFPCFASNDARKVDVIEEYIVSEPSAHKEPITTKSTQQNAQHAETIQQIASDMTFHSLKSLNSTEKRQNIPKDSPKDQPTCGVTPHTTDLKYNSNQCFSEQLQNSPQHEQIDNRRSKREQWLECMRAQCLPAGYLDALIMTRIGVTHKGLKYIHGYNLLRQGRSRAMSDNGSTAYVEAVTNESRDECFDMTGFRNYKTTIDRKGKIKFRRRRRASVPLENGR